MWKPDKYRLDIMQNLPHGAMAKLARKNNISQGHVNRILSGRRNDNFGIVKQAELIAAINIWKTRFCKFNSEL